MMVGSVVRGTVPVDQKLIGGSARLVCRGGVAQVSPSPTNGEALATVNTRFSTTPDGGIIESTSTSSDAAFQGKRRPPPGFLNLGNTCYANAALQCLFSTALSRALLEPRCFPVFRQYSSNSHLLILAQEEYDSVSETVVDFNVSKDKSNNNSKRHPPLPMKPKIEEATSSTVKPPWLKTVNKQQRRSQMSELCHWVTGELTDLNIKYRNKIAPHSPSTALDNNEHLSSIVAKVFHNCGKPPKSPRGDVVDPGNITRHVNRLSNCLRFGRQEDSHEFLRSLLSAITMDGHNKELSSLFDGLLESSVTCQQCGYASITRDRYMDISLEIGHAEIKTLVDALEHFTREEMLSGDNMVYCEACNCKQHSSKALRLATSPSILVCHLKRFDYDVYGRVRRLNKQVSFSPSLEISSFMSLANKSVPPTYELVAFVSHQGRSCSNGHYLAYVRGSGGSKRGSVRPWYRVSDSDVQEVDLDTVLKKEAYILMYEARGMRHHNIDGDCGSVGSMSTRKNSAVEDATTRCANSFSPTSHRNDKDRTSNWVIGRDLFQRCGLVDMSEEEQQSKSDFSETSCLRPAVSPTAHNNIVLDLFNQCGLVDLSEEALGLCFAKTPRDTVTTKWDTSISNNIEMPHGGDQEMESLISSIFPNSPEKKKYGAIGEVTIEKLHEGSARGRALENSAVSGRKERIGRSLSTNRTKRREPVAISSRSASTNERTNTATTGLLHSSQVTARHFMYLRSQKPKGIPKRSI